MFATFLLFLLYVHGLGYTLTRFIRDASLKNIILRIGIGLGGLPVLGLYLNAMNIPLDWRIFLVLTNALPAWDLGRCLWRRRSPVMFKRPRPAVLALLAIFLVHLAVFTLGAFSYPWLEDEDPYEHAMVVKYIAVEKNLNVPTGTFHYLNPYPPGYDIVFAVLHQTMPSLYTVLKFFNSLIVSLGLLFFYYYVAEISRNKYKALLGTFFLAVVPCYLTHFIWAHALVLTLFFPALLMVQKSSSDKRFVLPGMLVTAGIFLTQPTMAIKFVFLAVLIFLGASFVDRKWHGRYLWILGGGLVLSLIWWLPAGLDILSGASKFGKINSTTANTIDTIFSVFHPASGSATTRYRLSDYVLSPPYGNLINSPTGLGPFFFFLALGGLPAVLRVLTKGRKGPRKYALTVLLWTAYPVLGMNSVTFHLPVGLFAFRFWLLFAVGAALLAAECAYVLLKNIRRIFLIFIFFAVLLTSGYTKFIINTSMWYIGQWYDKVEELKGHIWLREHLGPNAKVFAFSDNFLVLSFDMAADVWSPRYRQILSAAVERGAGEFIRSLKGDGFQYMIVKEKDLEEFDRGRLSAILDELKQTASIQEITCLKDSFWVYKITGAEGTRPGNVRERP